MELRKSVWVAILSDATTKLDYKTRQSQMDHLRGTVVAAAPYTTGAPTPPAISIPVPEPYFTSKPLRVVPSYVNIDPASLSFEDLQIITQNKEQIAYDSGVNWTYETRRTAQPILDYLYLGPVSIARDKQWLRDNGITMLVVARDAQMAERGLLSFDKVAEELGIHAEHIDVSGPHELIRAFPSAVRKINDHMLSVYRSQALQRVNGGEGENSTHEVQEMTQDGTMVINEAEFRRGRVLVFCETGNGRSAGIVVAYLMAVIGMDMVHACQFIHYRRFCTSLDDDLKQILKNYEDILTAQRTVHKYELDAEKAARATALQATSTVGGSSSSSLKVKRGFEETMNQDGEEDDDMADSFTTDRDRYLNRQAFVPFVDRMPK